MAKRRQKEGGVFAVGQEPLKEKTKKSERNKQKFQPQPQLPAPANPQQEAKIAGVKTNAPKPSLSKFYKPEIPRTGAERPSRRPGRGFCVAFDSLTQGLGFRVIGFRV